MRINTRLTAPEYQRLMFALTYKKPLMIFLFVVGILNLTAAALHFAGIHIGYSSGSQQPFFNLFFGLIFTLGFPLVIYRSSKKSFDAAQRMQESITYDITEEKLTITGESFNTEKDWNETFKIQELRGFFLVYETILVANIISKKNLTTDECNELRETFNKIKAKYPEIL